MVVCKIFFCFLSLLTAAVVHLSKKKRPEPYLKFFRYGIWTPVKIWTLPEFCQVRQNSGRF